MILQLELDDIFLPAYKALKINKNKYYTPDMGISAIKTVLITCDC